MNALDKVKNIFGQDSLKRFKSGKGFRYEIGGGWGDRIEWCEVDRRIAGWKRRIPCEGDWLISKMISGKTGVYLIKNITRTKDPRDMFFAETEFIGYE